MVWQLVWIALALLLFVLIPLIALYVRRRWITGQGGVFDCAMQLFGKDTGVGWSLGLGRYRGPELQWFRSFSLSLKPRVRFQRGETHYISRRGPRAMEAVVLFDDSCIVTVIDAHTGEESTLAMSNDAAMALMSWLESAPPGAYRPLGMDSPS